MFIIGAVKRTQEKGNNMALFKESQRLVLHVGGMHCQKCVARVKDALLAVDGVTSAEVDLEKETATVQGCANKEALIAAVCALDFTAELA